MQLGQALERLSDPTSALACLNEACKLSHGNVKPLALMAYLETRLGQTDRATPILEAVTASARDRYLPSSMLALVHLGLGNVDSAFEHLDHAVEERDVHLVFLPVDAKWDSLRSDSRFHGVLERCGLRAGQLPSAGSP